ncbi:hypothetical protein BDF19DRAFT_442871 [Syncephalis fuscata]|nr:hypothetical protein BDF19DRAFT_442871 [Syncephalis fuscata]
MNTQDARDILDLGATASASATSSMTGSAVAAASTGQRHPGPLPREKKPDGVNRELFNLIGGLATLPISEQRVRFKEKPNFAAKQAKKGFTNSARDDDLVLYHWVNEADESTDRSFAGFNNVVDVVEYNDDEYDRFLSGNETKAFTSTDTQFYLDLDTDWSKPETDYLFSLCRQFDLRFLIIADRYNYIEGPDALPPPERTLEDIKERYYTVARRILKAQREQERKRILDKLFHRSMSEIKEEEALVAEVRRIQLQQRKLQRDHEHVMRLLNIREAPSVGPVGVNNGQHSTTPNTQGNLQATSHANANNHNNNTNHAGHNNQSYATPAPKHKSGGQQQRSATNAETGGESTKARKRKLTRKDSNVSGLDLSPNTAGTDLAASGTPLPKKERLTVGVSLRSARIQPIRAQTTANKVITCFRELGIGPRPVMATEKVCASYEQLRQSVIKMLERKKYADRLEQELRTLNYRKDELKGKPLPDSMNSSLLTGGGDDDDDDDLGTVANNNDEIISMTMIASNTPKGQGRKRSISGASATTASQKRIRR